MQPEQYTLIKYHVKKLLSINLNYYKEQHMKRRLDSWLVRSGESEWNEYFKRIKTDDNELTRFRNYLTINVSAFFRDAERWQNLRQVIADELLKEAQRLNPTNSGLKIWSAGCSNGSEPFSLAMILEDLAPSRNHYLLASDIDQGILNKARARGPFNDEDVQNLTPSQRSTYLEPGGPPHYVKKRLKNKIEFVEQDLLTNTFSKDFDLIVCRNVVLYFTSGMKTMLYRKFHKALRSGGILFVGATEIIPRSQDFGFIGHGISFYKKV